MKTTLGSRTLLFASLVALAGSFGSAAYSQTKVVKEVPARGTGASTGDELYREFCAVCHGPDGRGNGPAADALKQVPTDLTLIGRKSGGKFPELRMQQVIKGDRSLSAHGSPEMPTWGNVFKSISANQTFADMRINLLVAYLKQIQR